MKKLFVLCSLVATFAVSADVIDTIIGDTLRRGLDVAKGNYVKSYFCIKGDLSDVLGKSHDEILERVSEIAGIKEAAVKKGVKDLQKRAKRFGARVASLLGAKSELVVEEDDELEPEEIKFGKVEKRDIKHGRDAATFCLNMYYDKLAPGDLLSVVRNRDNHGVLRYKVSYIAKVVADKSGEKMLKKVAS